MKTILLASALTLTTLTVNAGPMIEDSKEFCQGMAEGAMQMIVPRAMGATKQSMLDNLDKDPKVVSLRQTLSGQELAELEAKIDSYAQVVELVYEFPHLDASATGNKVYQHCID